MEAFDFVDDNSQIESYNSWKKRKIDPTDFIQSLVLEVVDTSVVLSNDSGITHDYVDNFSEEKSNDDKLLESIFEKVLEKINCEFGQNKQLSVGPDIELYV